jgi:hypothetical protein
MDATRLTRAQRWRQAANLLNGSTALGLLVARAAAGRVVRAPGGLLVAERYRWRLPVARAWTLGDVVLTRVDAAYLLDRPALLAHEGRHAVQYAACLGPGMLPLYGIAAAWSWLRTGDWASRNVFERQAGLVDGGYVERAPPRRPADRLPARITARRARRRGRSAT